MKYVFRLGFYLVAALPLICSAEVMAGANSGSGKPMNITQDTSCSTCREMEKLEGEFTKLHYNVPAQAKIGEEKIGSVLNFSERLNHESTSVRGGKFYLEFESLVRLVGSSLPFDMETQGAADIAVIILAKDAEEKKRNPADTTPTKTEAIYQRVLGSMRDECRKTLLKSVVQERVCRLKADEKRPKTSKQDGDDNCPVSNFDYETCEAKQKTKP